MEFVSLKLMAADWTTEYHACPGKKAIVKLGLFFGQKAQSTDFHRLLNDYYVP